MNEQKFWKTLVAIVVLASCGLIATQVSVTAAEEKTVTTPSPQVTQINQTVVVETNGNDPTDAPDNTTRPVIEDRQGWIDATQGNGQSNASQAVQAPILDSDAMKLSFQALLRDNNGTPLPGPVDLEFNIYKTDGTLVEGPIIVRVVPLVNGVADTTFPVSASSFDGSGRELGVAVDGGAEMSPRLPLVTVPYSLRVDRVASAELDDTIELGSASANGKMTIWNATASVESIVLDGVSARISTYGSDGLEQIRLHGTSWGEMLMYDLDNNDLAVKLGASRFFFPGFPSSDTGGRLQLFNGVGHLRAQLTTSTNSGTLALYNGSNALATTVSVDGEGGGLFTARDADGTTTVLIEGAEVAADGAQITLRNATGTDTVFIDAQEGAGAALRLADDAGNQKIVMDAQEGAAGGGSINLYNNAGINTIEIDAEETDSASAIRLKDAAGVTQITLDPVRTGGGRVITPVLQITGGSDLSEQFDISGDVKPGMVVSIDPNAEGKLVVCHEAYDKKVAGIISGANGVLPGMLMGQLGSEANGDHPVALSGRVYCFADQSAGTIQAGDLLTTSSVKGRCMKVTDHTKAQGAIIGKAMGKVKNDMVLVLVNLQ